MKSVIAFVVLWLLGAVLTAITWLALAFLVFVGLRALIREAKAATLKPAVVIACQRGGIVPHGSLLVNAENCVGHDAYGSSFTARSLSIFDRDVTP